MTFVKICGIVREEDVRTAVKLGARALGFNFVPASPRCITPEQAMRLAACAAPGVWRVGVFVDRPEEEVRKITEEAQLTALQFHGAERPEEIRRFDGFVRIKGLRLKDRGSLADAAEYLEVADYLLLDAFVPGLHGGSGHRIALDLIEEAERLGLLNRCLLAGGLTPGNVGEVVRRFQPFGVDVASGVESAPGIKDHSLLKQFFEQIGAPS